MIKFLLFFSKTDYAVYKNCTAYAKNMQVSLGLFVILTGILAFVSGSYAISNLFIEFDWKTNTTSFNTIGNYVTPLLGLFYAIMIMAIDREIVSAKSKSAVFFRIPLAIVIGAVVAVPIELKMLEGRIEKQLTEDYKAENSGEREIKVNTIADLDAKRFELEGKVQFYWDQVNHWSNIMQQETVGQVTSGRTGKAGQGPAYEEAMRNMELHENNRVQAQKKLDDFLKYDYDKKIADANETYASQQITQQFDLLSKYQALAKLEANDSTNAVTKMTWGITILFMLFEIIPSLIKLMTPPTEYDAIIEARRRLNIQLTNALANEGLEDLDDSGNLKIKFKEMDKRPLLEEKKPMYYVNDIKKRLIID
ncbi:MAG: hypothetical protein ACI8ZM_000479 [Crocinitomix sp.]|jgi:hypothetical protein